MEGALEGMYWNAETPKMMVSADRCSYGGTEKRVLQPRPRVTSDTTPRSDSALLISSDYRPTGHTSTALSIRRRSHWECAVARCWGTRVIPSLKLT